MHHPTPEQLSSPGSRTEAIAAARALAHNGHFLELLSRRVALRTSSQEDPTGPAMTSYLRDEMTPYLQALGFRCELHPNPLQGAGPLLLAERSESDSDFTVLSYGHADVIRGQDDRWRPGLSPWTLQREGERVYGRGTADNKGQHSINFEALRSVLAIRGRLGFNLKLILETGEETGSPGLAAFCEQHRERLAADLFLASDGPRIRPDQVTLYGGSRGVINFDLRIDARDGAHHSGNWGGLISNPGIRLAHAIAAICDARGSIKLNAWRPNSLTPQIREALHAIEIDAGEQGPRIEPDWGEPGLSPAERVYAWNSFEVLAFQTGNPAAPVNAIPGQAHAHCQLRFVVGTDMHQVVSDLRKHLVESGFSDVQVLDPVKPPMAATRLDPLDPWCLFAVASVEQTLGKKPGVLPNLGGSLPNEVFADILGLPTIWVPHSYAACNQHAPNEHMLMPIIEEGLAVMAGL
ncbi:MAG: M20 peptidase family dipeptidase, partial [Betaproteobacteria bacterium]|nr:M20 peptidase family dipeptidase [Betaproteobacteria bacterium]